MNEELRLGIMMGSSSEDESSSPDAQLLEGLRFFRDESDARGGRSLFVPLPTTTVVVSARALPLESMVNLTSVLVRGLADSGIEARLERQRLCLNGETLPPARELGAAGRLLFCGGCCCGGGAILLVAGARVGNVADLAKVFLPRFSLALRDNPGRPSAFAGALPTILSPFFEVTSLLLADRRSSPCASNENEACDGSAANMESPRRGICPIGSYVAGNIPDDPGLVNRRPGSTPLGGPARANGSSILIGKESFNPSRSPLFAASGLGASVLSFFVFCCKTLLGS